MTWSIGIIEVGVIPGIPLSVYLPSAPAGASIHPPCYCYIATAGSRTILVDSGPDRSASAAAALDIIGDTSAQLDRGLRAWGVTASDVELIVHTHLHYDHMQNDLLFPHASVVVQHAELSWATSPESGPFYVGVGELASSLGERLRLIDGRTEILPGVTALPNGGHTPGHQSLLLQTPSGEVCVCGDIVSLEANLTTIGSVCPDVAATQAFLATARAEGWQMLPSHDPGLREHRWFVAASGSPESANTLLPQGQGSRHDRCC
jgi:glyoxylase-like metal-dependent hydrolase (beta-lactamase superfamily II)